MTSDSPSETLRADFARLYADAGGHDFSNPDVQRSMYVFADYAIALVLNKLPEKKHPVQYREFLVVDKKMRIEENQRQARSYVQGFNAYEAELRQILGEK